jgi:hypothetical protein
MTTRRGRACPSVLRSVATRAGSGLDEARPPAAVATLSAAVLELRPNCELCDRDLPPADPDARICSYECTFCADCVEYVLHGVCPNCGGGFKPRPIRPVRAWREGTGLGHDPPSDRRRRSPYDRAEIDAFVAAVRDVPAAGPERPPEGGALAGRDA